jgi:hypothetical protein
MHNPISGQTWALQTLQALFDQFGGNDINAEKSSDMLSSNDCWNTWVVDFTNWEEDCDTERSSDLECMCAAAMETLSSIPVEYIQVCCV